MLCLLRLDQPEAHGRRSVSRAKKVAAAFFRISRSSSSTRARFLSSLSSARSSLVRPSRSPASISALTLEAHLHGRCRQGLPGDDRRLPVVGQPTVARKREHHPGHAPVPVRRRLCAATGSAGRGRRWARRASPESPRREVQAARAREPARDLLVQLLLRREARGPLRRDPVRLLRQARQEAERP